LPDGLAFLFDFDLVTDFTFEFADSNAFADIPRTLMTYFELTMQGQKQGSQLKSGFILPPLFAESNSNLKSGVFESEVRRHKSLEVGTLNRLQLRLCLSNR
jgi:hypothetical protein